MSGAKKTSEPTLRQMLDMSTDKWAKLCQGQAAYSDLAPAMLSAAVIRERQCVIAQDELVSALRHFIDNGYDREMAIRALASSGSSRKGVD